MKITKLAQLRRVHLIGIKGTGMSSLALALRRIGVAVSGSDTPESFFLIDEKNFAKAGITVSNSFNSKHIPRTCSAVITSTAHTQNVELTEARQRKILILEYPDAVGLLTKALPAIAICGSHGKTTTTNLLAFILCASGAPALTIGGPTSQQVLDTDFKGKPKLLVFEADEYQNKLARYSPKGVVLTNIELDHPDFFKTDKQYRKTFIDFVRRIPKSGFLVYCTDDAPATAVAKYASTKNRFGYGFGKKADYRIEIQNQLGNETIFTIFNKKDELGTFKTTLLGVHNILNTTGAIVAAHMLGLSNAHIQNALWQFTGSHRRLQKVSDTPMIYDDYGHHPTELDTTIAALRVAYPSKKLIVAFQPHTYSRTKKFLKQFAKALTKADMVIILDIYGSREGLPKNAVHAKNLVSGIKQCGGKAIYGGNLEQAALHIKKLLKPTTLLLTLGAGDVWKLHSLLK